MTTKIWMYIMVFVALGMGACDNDDDNRRSVNDVDEDFVEKAALSNMTEVDFGEIAASKGDDPLIREFGQMMVTEHTTAQTELQAIANDIDDIDWPRELDPQHRQIREQLNSLSGHAFDSLYMATQVTDHQMTISNFETEIATGTDATVKGYASKYLPHIQAHLSKADSIQTVITPDPGN